MTLKTKGTKINGPNSIWIAQTCIFSQTHLSGPQEYLFGPMNYLFVSNKYVHLYILSNIYYN